MTSFNDEKKATEKILVVAGGYSFSSEASVELLNLDDLASGWVSGPDLPTGLYLPSMVQVEDGGVVVVGGENSLGQSGSLFKLTPSADEWLELGTELKGTRSRHVSFLIPDELAACHAKDD